VFHKIGTPLYFCNNILPCGPISIIDIPNCSAENWLGICDTFTNLTFRYYLWIAEEWDKLDQRIIEKAVGEWRKRLRACVAAGGGQFKHRM